MSKDYLIIHKKVLPDYFMKVIEVNQMIKEKKYPNISEAVKAMGISRSTYYKYKDYVFLPEESEITRKAILSVDLIHRSGSLSSVLNVLKNNKISILTISQSLPINELANVIMSIDIADINISMSELIEELKVLKQVKDAKLIAFE
ncbi:MAG TPA: ACT domain-containing protein [Erysipelotrichaceae bacterium]|jgi:chorismate mutase|nr:ACT domain-containing protein [Erysipelotrichia bacterium]HPX32334.1 ACT domain-containing protein [Erysipelotrichaceae bacterium]HQA84845.1 ACT domain-containing protein [Erysipelotrichaceae bacterium]